VALLVMGDGSACRTVKAPGYLDERAEAYDAAVAAALGGADTAALAALDAELSAALKASGRAPWQVLAGAAEGADVGGELLYDEAPYGVGYFVAAWS
jgi:aromatic ring-opening dioxygenase LigB subunit